MITQQKSYQFADVLYWYSECDTCGARGRIGIDYHTIRSEMEKLCRLVEQDEGGIKATITSVEPGKLVFIDEEAKR
jgi:hypothetical protein